MKHSKIVTAILGGLFLAVPSAFTQRVALYVLKQEVLESRLAEASRKNDERMVRLKTLFESVGCPSDRLSEQKIEGTKLPNLVCTLPGSADSEIVVGAHYDYNSSYGWGVIDNWSGAALLPSLYQSLHTSPRKHTFTFIGFAGEERGLIGSRFYVKQLGREERARIRAMVNLDCLGLSSTKVDYATANKRLLDLLSRMAAHLKLPLAGIDTSRIGMTDSDSFAQARVPIISIHSITQETLRTLHSIRDRPDMIRKEDYYGTYRLVSAYLALLDTSLE